MPEIIFLTLAEAVEIHSNQIKLYGGHDGIQNMRLLESAVAMPYASFGDELLHRDIFEMAAAYAYHICQNHPFVDGNKRAALACALVFLELNGISLLDPEDLLYSAMMDVALGKLDKKKLAELFSKLPQS
ncbi:MAG: type II toxin-antitoxin system death-on-curing family toxin [Candidatus Schekmanbacteria bacterium]|nr:type II toxin-antitoxin system death-on-curing family toxin [Candidatus Schekmanbacteria bacterium]